VEAHVNVDPASASAPTMDFEFDLLVLGGGSGGIATARRAAQHGARVALVESGRLGGTCVNVGCVPKKLMWHAAQIAEMVHDANGYGFDIGSVAHDWARLKQRRDAYVQRLNDLYAEGLAKDRITVIAGRGRVIDAHTVEHEGRRLRARHLLIATGGKPRWPEIPGAEHGIDSDGFFALEHCPKRVVIVGSGYIAVELSGVLQALGAEVTLIARGERLLSHFDAMLGDELLQQMQDHGVTVLRGRQLASVALQGTERQLTLADGTIVRCDCLLWATGRVPNSRDCGLAEVGVAMDDAGHVQVDAWQTTNIASIHAVGDVVGHATLTPVAIAAGRRLADRLFGGKAGRKLDYDNIPSVVFSHPPIGSVGISEVEARARHGDAVTIYQTRFKGLYYGVLDHKRETRMKLVCVGDEQHIVGLHVIGAGADEMLQGFAVAVRMGATKRDFDDTLAIHPTAAEEFVTLR